MSQPSNRGRKRRCPNDQYGPCMEFTHAGPHPHLLGAQPKVSPTRDRSGKIIATRRYSASAEVYNIGAAIGSVATLLEATFGRERDSSGARPKRGRGGRKPVTA